MMPTAAYYRAHRAVCAEQTRRRYYIKRGRPVPPKGQRLPRGTRRSTPVVVVPIPDLDPHPLVDAARSRLRPYERAELGTSMDAIARDLIGAWVVAALSGDDADAAMVAARARYRHDRATLVHGTTIVDDLWR